jgi:hypothetical protein
MSVISGESKFGLDIGATTGAAAAPVDAAIDDLDTAPIRRDRVRLQYQRFLRAGLPSAFLVSADGQHFMWSAGQFDVALADGMREPLGSTVQTLCGR